MGGQLITSLALLSSEALSQKVTVSKTLPVRGFVRRRGLEATAFAKR
jgi:hypothetical protein